MIAPRLLSLLIGYVLGWFPTGYLYGKSKGVDVRSSGSGNIGMTNTLRVLGVKAGVITLIGDMGKALLAIGISYALFHRSAAEILPLVRMYAGAGAVLGHDFPLPMKFKGGKGIASSVGLMAGAAPFTLPVSMGLFFLALGTTKYVSLGSILLVTSFAVQAVIFGQLGWFPPLEGAGRIELYLLAALVAVLGIVRHRANIERLLAGNENKFQLKE